MHWLLAVLMWNLWQPTGMEVVWMEWRMVFLGTVWILLNTQNQIALLHLRLNARRNALSQ
jgi:hypothetical protein